MTGPAIFTSVHTAATPITPAPKKRTSAEKIVLAQVSAPPAIGCAAVRNGSSTHQPTTSPRNIAAPTEMPTRRTEERRVGKERVRTWRCQGSQYSKKKNNKRTKVL